MKRKKKISKKTPSRSHKAILFFLLLLATPLAIIVTQQNQDVRQHAQEVPTPTFACLGSCPEPTVATEEEAPVEEQPAEEQPAEEQPAEENPEENAEENGAEEQNDEENNDEEGNWDKDGDKDGDKDKDKKGKKNKGDRKHSWQEDDYEGLIPQIFRFFIQLLNLILQLLGGTPIPLPEPGPLPTGEPEPTDELEPTPIESGPTDEAPQPTETQTTPTAAPTATNAPTPTTQPTIAPTVPPTATSAPTTAAIATPTTSPISSTAWVAPTTDKCANKYTLTNSIQKNYGDPVCNYTKNDVFALLQQLDPANANFWFSTVIPCESSYNPNAWAGPTAPGQAALDIAGAWGLFQMGSSKPPGSAPPAPGKNGVYDRNDVNWQLQASNAVNYNVKVINSNWRYWACARSRWK